MVRLKKEYDTNIRATLKKKFDYKNDNQIPKLTKIVLNMGVGENANDSKRLQHAVNEMELISGQKPIITKAKKSISQFKLREEVPIGCKVTLRKDMMYEFLERLITIAMPRIRDFRGVSDTSFDGKGNYAMGITEQIIFPEINYDKVDKIRGMDIVICTSASTDEEARALLAELKMPFRINK